MYNHHITVVWLSLLQFLRETNIVKIFKFYMHKSNNKYAGAEVGAKIWKTNGAGAEIK